MIEVEIQNGERLGAALGPRESQSQSFHKCGTIGQSGQRVGVCQFDDHPLGRFALGDIAKKPNAADILPLRVVERRRVMLDSASVPSLELVLSLDLGMGVEFLHASQELRLGLYQ